MATTLFVFFVVRCDKDQILAQQSTSLQQRFIIDKSSRTFFPLTLNDSIVG